MEEKQRKEVENELTTLKKNAYETENDIKVILSQVFSSMHYYIVNLKYIILLTFFFPLDKRSVLKENTFKESLEYGSPKVSHTYKPLKETIFSQKAAIARICKEGKNFLSVNPYFVLQSLVCILLGY